MTERQQLLGRYIGALVASGELKDVTPANVYFAMRGDIKFVLSIVGKEMARRTLAKGAAELEKIFGGMVDSVIKGSK